MSFSPYRDFPNTSYWKRSVAEKSIFDMSGLWNPKFKLGINDRFATYGSCFAQHFSNALRAHDISWINSESAPGFVSGSTAEEFKELEQEFNYGIFSSRTQNIYTPTMLLQWLNISINNDHSSYEIWEQDGRFYDPLRPTVEPNGFASKSELIRAREVTAKSFADSIKKCTCLAPNFSTGDLRFL